MAISIDDYESREPPEPDFPTGDFDRYAALSPLRQFACDLRYLGWRRTWRCYSAGRRQLNLLSRRSKENPGGI